MKDKIKQLREVCEKANADDRNHTNYLLMLEVFRDKFPPETVTALLDALELAVGELERVDLNCSDIRESEGARETLAKITELMEVVK